MNRPSFYFLLFSACLPVLLSAQPGERGGKTTKDSSAAGGNVYAIIVGLSKYKEVRPLQYAHKDAQAFEDFLLSPAGGKIPRINVETFLNENATRNNVGDAISVIARKAKPGDRVYFFFAGHGDMEDLTQIENGLLLLYNSPNGNYFGMNDDVLEIIDLKRYLSPLAQRGVEMIFIVDACHSGNLKGGVEGAQQTATALASSWGKEYKILSCQPNQLSLESAEWGGGRGLFSLQLEEGMKGLADKNNDKKITFAELQRYITDNVASFSEDKQIPVVSGDLSKSFVKVDSATLVALRKQKAADYPMMAMANTKGSEEKYIDSLDPAGKKIYISFKKNLEDKKLIWPKDTNALKDYKTFIKKYKNKNPLVTTMRRNLATSLNERFNTIVGPMLKGETSYSTRDECYVAAAELDSCLRLLGDQHYMYTNLKARKLFMNAMSITWALNAADYNVGLKPEVEKSIKLLEESAALEPNAAYTMSQLGFLYCIVFDYEKAYPQFQKYLDLRPNDYYSKLSLTYIFSSLGKYDKAEELFLQLMKSNPPSLELYLGLADVYMNNDKPDEALRMSQQVIDSLHDKFNAYFTKGVTYSHINNIDSAVHYYKLGAKEMEDCLPCYNNIGHIFFTNNQIDSATFYFKLALDKDSTYPFSSFNVGTIEAAKGNTFTAVSKFVTSILHSKPFDQCFNTNMQLYLGKKYTITDQKLYEDFTKKSVVFNFQYFSYLSILYCYIRDESLIGKTELIDFVFSQMQISKNHDALTWYHHACYKALLKDKSAALESLEKSLKLGFGNYFMLTSDNDLDTIRSTPEFKALLGKYFP